MWSADGEESFVTRGESAIAIAADVAAGRRTAALVVAECIDRSQRSHRALNALVQPRFGQATEEATRLADGPPGPLVGVPVSVKECFAVRGSLTTLGIAARCTSRDEEDASIVSRLRAAGAVILGKANVPQAMYLHETDNPVWGRTCHPTASDRGPGGSSGGDAALVAAGVVPLAVGNDLAGSIRQPAHACGIVGLLPRSTTLGSGGAFETMPHIVGQRSRAGFLTRNVADAGLALDATCGRTEIAFSLPARIRIGWWDETGPIPPSAAVRRAVAIAIERLRLAGAEVRALNPEIAAEAAWIHLALMSADGGRSVRRLFAGERPMAGVSRLLWMASVPRWARPLVAGACAWGGRRIEAAGLRATGPRRGRALNTVLHQRREVDAIVAGWGGEFDAVVCPVSALPALRHGTAARLVLAASPCLLANLLDLAAGTVPVTTVATDEERGRGEPSDPVEAAAARTDHGSAGLPVGVQVIGLDRGTNRRSEAVVLETMRLIELAGLSSAIA